MKPQHMDQALIDKARRASLVEVVGRHVRLQRRGDEYIGSCPFHGERTPSFTIVPAKNFYHCFGCGAHGDALRFVIDNERLKFRDAVDRLVGRSLHDGRAGRAAPRTARSGRARSDDTERKRRWAWDVWRASAPVAGTLAESYLASRGITLNRLGGPPGALRYRRSLVHNPTGQRFPALVAAVQWPDGKFMTIHRTFLRPDGRDKAAVDAPKMVGGSYAGGAIRLTPAAPRLVIGEGIETCLSVLQALRATGDDHTGVWCAVALANMAGGGRRRPWPRRCGDRLPSPVPDPERPGVCLPGDVAEVVLAADADAKDMQATEMLLTRAAARLRDDGRKAFIARPAAGGDFNDMLMRTRRVTP